MYARVKQMADGRENEVEEDPEYLFLKKELIKATQGEMNLEMELNQKVNSRKLKVEDLRSKLRNGSPQLQNLLTDIMAKREQIIYLEESIR